MFIAKTECERVYQREELDDMEMKCSRSKFGVTKMDRRGMGAREKMNLRVD